MCFAVQRVRVCLNVYVYVCVCVCVCLNVCMCVVIISHVYEHTNVSPVKLNKFDIL